jgi:hypothetical protein
MTYIQGLQPAGPITLLAQKIKQNRLHLTKIHLHYILGSHSCVYEYSSFLEYHAVHIGIQLPSM